jgi:hypothetical protein
MSMPEMSVETEAAVRAAMTDADALRERMLALYQQTDYEDLEHGAMALEIVHHTLGEVLEHKGLGGHIEATADSAAHAQAERLKSMVEHAIADASDLLRSHQNEDLETAIKALTIAEGSLEEVAERYE